LNTIPRTSTRIPPAVPYKKIAVLKVREEEFPKNTLRKILRFKLDMTID
jgi:hypothetical protein